MSMNLKQGIGVVSRSLTAQRALSGTRSLFSRFLTHITAPGLVTRSNPSLIRHLNSSQNNIHTRFSLPVKHALSRPFAPPRLPKPPPVPANVSQVGLGTARAFHSGRPIFQNMVDNVPIATRALWEAEWEVKMNKAETRRMRRAAQNKTLAKSKEMLKPNPKPILAEPRSDMSDLDVYFPVQPIPSITTHLLVPLAPTPTARFPLPTHTDSAGAHPLLPVSDLASIHVRHHNHSLKVSTLFARLDAANVWDDPGVNVDAYAFGPRHDTRERQCTVLRVTFRGWNSSRVCAILGSTEEWYSLEETLANEHPALVPLPNQRQDTLAPSRSSSLESIAASEVEVESDSGLPSPLPMRASASAQHDLVLPILDFSSAFSPAADTVPPHPQPVFLRTVSELTYDAQLGASERSHVPTPVLFADSASLDSSWDHLGLSSCFVQRIEEVTT